MNPNRNTLLVGAFVLLIATGAVATVAAQSFDLSRFSASRYLVLVIADSPGDDRLFELNLAVSLEWERLQRRSVAVVEVVGARNNPRAVAAQFGATGADFAGVVVNPQREVMFRGTAPELNAILARIDVDAGARTGASTD